MEGLMNSNGLYNDLTQKNNLNFAWINALELPHLTDAIGLRDEFLPKVVAFYEGSDDSPIFEYTVHIGAFSEENLRHFLFTLLEENSSVRKIQIDDKILSALLDNNKIEKSNDRTGFPKVEL